MTAHIGVIMPAQPSMTDEWVWPTPRKPLTLQRKSRACRPAGKTTEKMNRFFNIKKADAVTTIFLYGDIGYEVESGQIAAELAACATDGGRIDVRINSNGGDVFSGIAIYNALKNSPADIRLYVDGVAASMASVIALCGKPVEMSKYARLMLHSVSGGCYGNKQEMAKCIAEIESLEDSLADIYAGRMGLTKEEVKAAYFDGADHWLTAREALDMGLVDGIYDAEPVPDGSTPEDIYNAFNNRLAEPQKQSIMNIEEIKKHPQFKDCNTVDDVVATALRLTDEAGGNATLAEENKTLKAQLKTLEDKIAVQAAKERKALLDDAERDGRINAGNRAAFEGILERDMDEGREVLSSLTPKRKVMADLHVQPGGSESPWERRQKQIRENRAKGK